MIMKTFLFFPLLFLFLSCCDKGDTPCITCPQPADTTSHEFIWQTDTLSDLDWALYDVAIINDTLAYAVGEVYLKDSLGQRDPTPYCIAKWDGIHWKLQRLKFFPPGAIGDSLNAKGNSIFANNAHDIWMSAGAVFHWDGLKWNIIYNTGADGATRIWGDGSANVYFVGRGGNIIRYTNGTWTKLESGTTTGIDDVWGVTVNGVTTAYCAVSDFFQPKDKKILRIQNATVDSISWTTGRDVRSVWTADGSILYAGGDGLFENGSGEWKQILYGASKYIQHIRGSAANNVFAVGDLGLIAHYNGSTWKTFSPEFPASYIGVAVTKDLVIAVGTNGSAVATIGRRKK
jgi:hypothetical protein